MAQSAAPPPAEAGDSRHQGTPRGGSFPDLSRSIRAAAIDRDGSAADPVAPPFDPDQARQFFEALGIDPEDAWFRTFGRGGANRSRCGRDLHGFDAAALARDARSGEAAYMVTGEVDRATGKRGGVQGCDVLRHRLLFAEWDNRPIAWQIEAWREHGLPEPTCIVLTGGRSVHLWWRLAEAMEPTAWRALMERLTDHLGSDRIGNPARVMRLPGSPYFDKKTSKPTGTRAEVLHTSRNRYTVADIEACLPSPAQVNEQAAPRTSEQDDTAALRELTAAMNGELPPRTVDEIRQAAQFIPQRIGGQGTYEQDRRALCGCSAALADAGVADPDGEALALLGGKWPSHREAAQALGSSTTRAAKSFWGIARDHGFDLKQRRHLRAVPSSPETPPGAAAMPEAEPFSVLGWNDDRTRVWFRHRKTSQIASAKPEGSGQLLRMAPLQWWEDNHPRKNKDGEVVGVAWLAAASKLIEAADAAGVFDAEALRGRGVWIDGGRVVWHLGDRLEVDGRLMPLADAPGRHQYGLTPALPIDPAAAPLTDEQGRAILAAIEALGWQGRSDHLHLAGWVVLSNVCGAIPKRPGLQITSRFGSGKTDLIESVIQPLQAGIGLSSTGSTEAGIRQLIGRDALPATVDESEAEDGNGKRREAQLRLLRYAYDGAQQVKGTPAGDPIRFCLRSALALAGINATIPNPADRSRLAVISRRSLPGDQWAAAIARRDAAISREIGEALIRRTVSNLPTLLHNIAACGRVVARMAGTNNGGRIGDTYGALLAGAHLLTSTARLTDAEAEAWIRSTGWSVDHANNDDSDHGADEEGRQALDHLLGFQTPWRHPDDFDREGGRPTTGRITLRELLAAAPLNGRSVDAEEARRVLGRHGLKVTAAGLAIAHQGPGIAAVFASTKWQQGGHRARLREIDGAALASTAQHFPGDTSRRAVIVPWEAVGGMGEDEPEPTASAAPAAPPEPAQQQPEPEPAAVIDDDFDEWADPVPPPAPHRPPAAPARRWRKGARLSGGRVQIHDASETRTVLESDLHRYGLS